MKSIKCQKLTIQPKPSHNFNILTMSSKSWTIQKSIWKFLNFGAFHSCFCIQRCFHFSKDGLRMKGCSFARRDMKHWLIFVNRRLRSPPADTQKPKIWNWHISMNLLKIKWRFTRFRALNKCTKHLVRFCWALLIEGIKKNPSTSTFSSGSSHGRS